MSSMWLRTKSQWVRTEAQLPWLFSSPHMPAGGLQIRSLLLRKQSLASEVCVRVVSNGSDGAQLLKTKVQFRVESCMLWVAGAAGLSFVKKTTREPVA